MTGARLALRVSSDTAQRRRFGGIFARCGSFPMLQADSSCCSQNFWNANEIVGGRREHEEPFHQSPSAMSGLAQTADRLHPPEWFLDPLSLDRADAIAGMACRARV